MKHDSAPKRFGSRGHARTMPLMLPLALLGFSLQNNATRTLTLTLRQANGRFRAKGRHSISSTIRTPISGSGTRDTAPCLRCGVKSALAARPQPSAASGDPTPNRSTRKVRKGSLKLEVSGD